MFNPFLIIWLFLKDSFSRIKPSLSIISLLLLGIGILMFTYSKYNEPRSQWVKAMTHHAGLIDTVKINSVVLNLTNGITEEDPLISESKKDSSYVQIASEFYRKSQNSEDSTKYNYQIITRASWNFRTDDWAFLHRRLPTNNEMCFSSSERTILKNDSEYHKLTCQRYGDFDVQNEFYFGGKRWIYKTLKENGYDTRLYNDKRIEHIDQIDIPNTYNLGWFNAFDLSRLYLTFDFSFCRRDSIYSDKLYDVNPIYPDSIIIRTTSLTKYINLYPIPDVLNDKLLLYTDSAKINYILREGLKMNMEFPNMQSRQNARNWIITSLLSILFSLLVHQVFSIIKLYFRRRKNRNLHIKALCDKKNYKEAFELYKRNFGFNIVFSALFALCICFINPNGYKLLPLILTGIVQFVVFIYLASKFSNTLGNICKYYPIATIWWYKFQNVFLFIVALYLTVMTHIWIDDETAAYIAMYSILFSISFIFSSQNLVLAIKRKQRSYQPANNLFLTIAFTQVVAGAIIAIIEYDIAPFVAFVFIASITFFIHLCIKFSYKSKYTRWLNKFYTFSLNHKNLKLLDFEYKEKE